MLDYEGLTVRDLKRIVNREEATPAAIGLFVAYDTWRRATRPSILTNELLRWIEDKWRFSAFANELEYWISLGEALARLGAMVESNRAMSNIAPLGLQIEIFLLEISLYAKAYEAARDQAAAAGLKLKLPGLSAQQADILATLAAKHAGPRPSLDRRVDAIESQAKQTYTSLLALQSILQDLEALLGTPGPSEEAREGAEKLVESVSAYKRQIDSLAPLAPRWARRLSRAVDLQHVEPDGEEAELEKMLSLYLTPNWRAWARAGVNLRELANKATGIVDLIRHAEQAAALEATLAAPDRLVTQEQASQISQAVKAVALELGKKSGRNEFGAIYGELYRKFGITSYKELPARRFEEAMQFLTEWHAEQAAALEADHE